MMHRITKKTSKTVSKKNQSASAPTAVQAPQAAPATVKPQVSKVSFQVLQPQAKSVYVAGSFNGWKPERSPLLHKGNGRWVGDLTVEPGRYEYLFVVDGRWMADPNARESVSNPFGGQNSVIEVSA